MEEETRQHFPERGELDEEKLERVEIPKEEWEVLQTIAKRVAGDFGMEVKLGPLFLEEINPLTGEKERIPYIAFENIEERSITFNPLFVKENPREAKRVAAHEGAHRAITRGEHEIGLTREQVRKLSSSEYLGFHSFRNIGLEDPRVNNWDTQKFPGLVELNKEVYDEQLREENAQFIAPEVNLIVSRLGRYPRYAEAASELVRFWHKEQYSAELKPEIQKFLKRVQKYATEYQTTLPPTERSLKESEVVEIARECFEKYHEDIWPEVKKLVEMDLHTEEQRQVMKEIRQKQKELELKRQEMKGAQEQGDKQRQKELQKEIEELEKELNPFNRLPEEVKKELQEQIDKAIREAAEKLNKEIEEKEKQIKDARGKQEELDREIQGLEAKAKSASGKEKEELEKQIQEKRAEKLAQEMKQKQAEEELEDIQSALDDIQSGQEMPYPEDKLSDKTKRELDKLFKRLPKRKRREIEDRAQRALEDFEDAVNKELEGKLNEDKPESHKERREKEKAEREAARKSKEEKEAMERLQKELEKIRREKMTEYEKIREEVVSLIDNLYYRLRRILLPEEFGGEELGWPTGKELDIERAIQAKMSKDVLQKEKMWIRETAPEKKDYRFCHLIDLSGSMKEEKIRETLKGLIVVTEAIDRIENLKSENLNIEQATLGFSDSALPAPIKDFRQRFTREIQNKFGKIPDLVGGGTNTYDGTLKALEALKKNLGETGNFLLTFSDGEPNHDIRDKLKRILKSKEERKGIKVGLIWLGESEPKEDLEKLVQEYGYDFGLVMPAVKPSDPKEKNFAEKLADLLEDIVKNPEKY